MLKRTKGYILLTLLVVTGFAGKMSSDTISTKERKFLVDYLKDTKTALVKSLKGLSEGQLNFKAAPDRWSIKECVQHIALAEAGLWSMTEAALKQPANPQKRSEIKVTDAALTTMVTDRSRKAQAPEVLQPQKGEAKTAEQALDNFKEKRNSLIKYVKTSTDDMRNHVAQTMMGSMDAYQLMLLIAAHSKRHTLQIEEVKADPAFPK